MADKDTKKDVLLTDEVKKVRITLSGNRLQEMQTVTKALVENAKKFGGAGGVSIKGPIRLPNKHLRICCRRTPCGEGSKTWDNFEMTIYKRYIDLSCSTAQIKEITMFQIPSNIEINVEFIS
jgi:small subunit ribosomal protein S20e